MIAALFTSLAVSLAQSNDSTKLTVWTSDSNARAALQAVGDPFCERFKCRLDVQVLNQNLTQQFRTAALSQKGPDLLLWAHDVSGELAESGLISPIHFPPRLRADLHAIGIRAFTYKNEIYGYPLSLAAISLIRNTRLAPQPAATLEEMIAAGQKIAREHPGTFGLLFEVKSAYFTFPFFSAQGAEFFISRDGVAGRPIFGLDTRRGITALEKIVELTRAGALPPNTDRNIAMDKMLSGKLAFMFDGPWALKDLKREKVPFAVDPLPKWQGKEMRALVGAHGLMIRRSSPNQSLAREFVERAVLTSEGMRRFLDYDPRIPALKSISSKNWSSEFPELKGFATSVDSGVVMPNTPAMGAIWPAMKAALHQATEGQSSPSAALRAAGEKVRSQIDSTYQ